MFQVSRFKSSFALIFVFLLIASIVTVVMPEKAEARTASKNTQTRANIYLTSIPQPIAKQDVNFNSSHMNVTKPVFLGLGCSTLGPILSDGCKLVTTITETIGGSVECVKDVIGCFNGFIYSQLGGGVAWAANGIITLVTETRKECAVTGSNKEWANEGSISSRLKDFNSERGGNVNCSERLVADYFGSDQKDTIDILKSIRGERENIITEIDRALIRMELDGISPNDVDYLKLQKQKEDLESAGIQEMTETMNQQLDRDGVFYTPKSTVSTPTFNREYGKYVTISILIMVPMIIAAAVQSLITGKGGIMMRSVFIHMPLAIFGMIITPGLVRMLMVITDSFSAFIVADVEGDMAGFFTDIGPMFTNYAAMTFGAVLIPVAIVAIIFLLAALFVWFILNIREASISLVAVFLPIALTASIWPALGGWAVKAIKLMIASIISKIFIVGAISLGLGIVSGSTGAGSQGFSLSHLVYGSVIFSIAAFQPSLVLRFMDEIGDSLTNNGSSGTWLKLAGALGVASQLPALKGLLPGNKENNSQKEDDPNPPKPPPPGGGGGGGGDGPGGGGPGDFGGDPSGPAGSGGGGPGGFGGDPSGPAGSGGGGPSDPAGSGDPGVPGTDGVPGGPGDNGGSGPGGSSGGSPSPGSGGSGPASYGGGGFGGDPSGPASYGGGGFGGDPSGPSKPSSSKGGKPPGIGSSLNG